MVPISADCRQRTRTLFAATSQPKSQVQILPLQPIPWTRRPRPQVARRV